jgi:Holliday junction resolvasome RuvABC endonuclease subunit
MSIINAHNVKFIVSELPHGSQNAKAAVMIGIVVGVLQTLSQCGRVPIEWFSENDAKKALFGRISASKAEVISAIEATFEMQLTGPKYRKEAIADALAIYNIAQATSPTLQILTK